LIDANLCYLFGVALSECMYKQHVMCLLFSRIFTCNLAAVAIYIVQHHYSDYSILHFVLSLLILLLLLFYCCCCCCCCYLASVTASMVLFWLSVFVTLFVCNFVTLFFCNFVCNFVTLFFCNFVCNFVTLFFVTLFVTLFFVTLFFVTL